MLRALTSLVFVVFTVAFGLPHPGTTSLLTRPSLGLDAPGHAKEEKNPLPVNDATLAAGKKLFSRRASVATARSQGTGPTRITITMTTWT
jgi:hypothetical protein